MNLSLTTSGGSAPSALQWTLGYSPGSIGSINVAAGPALTPAGWTLTCQASSGTVICIAIGMGDTVIAGGTVAIVTVGLGSAASGSTVPMSVSGTLGALPNGTGLAVTGTGGTITVLALVPVINSATTASGTVGSAFSYQIAATNSPTSYAATGLPAGLSVNTTTGLLSGTPTAAGTSTVTLSATNSGGTGSATLTLTIQPAAPVITSATSASGKVGSAFSYQIAATNSPASYAATGLPAGLSVNTTTGLLSGTPTAAGTSTVTLSATNSGGTGSATLTLTVTAESPVITSATTASGTVGSTFSYQIVATNSPTSYAATGLPAGLSFSTTTGLISGTPTAAGTSTVKLRATNSDGTGKATLTLTIARRSDTVPTTSKGIGPSEVQPQNTVTDLFCTPKIITAGSQATCELRLASTSAATPIQVTSNSGQVKAPSAVLTRASQTHLTFQVIVDAAAKEQVATITAMAGPTTAEDTIQVKPSSGPVLIVPGTQAARLGKALGFTVTAVDPNGLSVQLTASDVPAGASFDAANGLFEWIPSASQSGKYKVTFGATNSGGQSSSVEVRVNVSSGVPSVASAERLMCSPGALASLNGSGFAEPSSALSDPSGQSVVLGDTRVRINDQYVPVLAASDARVTFLCPTLEPDTQLEMTVETDAGISEPLRAKMQEATPMIFSLDGSGQNQGVISFAETTDLVMARNFRVPAHPAQPGDEILIWCSGLGLPSQVPTVTVLVEVGGVDAEVESVHAVPGHVGVYTIQARVPAVMNFGDAVPVQVRVNTLGGKQFNSNPVRVAVELVSQ
ncbi:MAG: putative Ig domain-containing protein [Terriglobia bacterium]